MEGKVFLCGSLIWAIILLGQIHGYKSCIVKERKALMEIKTYFVSQSSFENRNYTLPSWTNDTKSDCCLWEGVYCNRTTGRVIKLSLDRFWLKDTSFLNLSLLHPFEDIRSLNISRYGQYPSFTGVFDDVEGHRSLRRLRNLEILDLSYNMFNNSIFPFLNAATSLTVLLLQRNYLDGPFSVKGLKNLELLDLSENKFNGSIPIRELSALKKLKGLDLSGNEFSESTELQDLKNWTHLEVLGFARNKFNGPIPIQVCKMKNLQELDLGGNYIGGQVPSCLGSLNKLRVLDISSNQISGNLPSSFSGLESLEYLSLLDNNFTSLFSLNPLANLTKLTVFKISSTSHMIQVQIETTWQPKFQLNVVELPSCSLQKIPKFLNYQKNLRLVDLSNNRLSGHIPTWLLGNNPELEVLQLKNNLFTIFHMPTLTHKLVVFDFSANDIGGALPDNIGHALPNLFKMNGSNNMLQGNFPSSMGEMKSIIILDLSYNNFTGELPRSFVMGCFSLQFLKLSHNKFCGHFLTKRANFTSLETLRINNNLITGKIGAGLRSSRRLSVLDMSNNRLTGAIPPSLLDIYFLDLSGNLLSKALPSHLCSLDYSDKWLFLHNNNLTGPIPSTLFENITMLDLRNNKFSGTIPQFANAQGIKVLLLSGNNLTGSIPRQLCDLSNIGLLDLSDNKLNGFIPSCLNNLSFGLGGAYEGSYGTPTAGFTLEFYESILVSTEFEFNYETFLEIKFATKQRYDSYKGASPLSRGTLDFMYGLDISNNELSGVIPTELGHLSEVKVVNLSHNFLSSSIPDSFSKLKDIESLDLSFNMLHGGIPPELTNLTYLSYFNVSYNNLSCLIPQGSQFDTFNENSYVGNPLLCGKPIDISCETKNLEETDNERGGKEEDGEASIDMVVFYWSSTSTYVIALICSLVLNVLRF